LAAVAFIDKFEIGRM